MLKAADLNQIRIDPAQRKFRTLFENLQGNILKPRDRTHAALIFFRIKPGRAGEARRWIRIFAAAHVTSAKRQLDDRQARRGLFCSLLFSAAGYRALGGGLRLPADRKFRAGMKRSGIGLQDPEPRTWEAPYRGEIHALLILGHNSLPALNRVAARSQDDIATFARVLKVERGRAWRNARGQRVEHFGYVDGVSQPLFFVEDVDRRRRDGDGTDEWDPSAPLRLVLARDPNTRAADAFGSYLVFRKLAQNVQAFLAHEHDMTQALALPDPRAGRAGAVMVGRFRDGTPVTLSPIEGLVTRRTKGSRALIAPNNFTYAEDPNGSRCPFQAHIRAANPRDRASLDHRIVRCGITYGTRRTVKGDFADRPSRGVGLLFMCFQRDIGHQFEWTQRRINGSAGRVGDPVTGQGDARAVGLWPARYGGRARVRLPAPAMLRRGRGQGLVTLLGGEYFFAPSLPFLKGL